MAKFRVQTKGNMITAVRKQFGDLHIAERELEILEENTLLGFFRPQVISTHRMEYAAPLGVSLKSYLKDKPSVHKFYSMLAQIVEMAKRVERYGLYMQNVVFDMDLVYVKKTTGELFFIYEPLMERKNAVNVFAFLGDITGMLKFQDKQLEIELQKLKTFLKTPEYYRIEDIEQFIRTNYPQIYQQVACEEETGTTLLAEEEGTTLLAEEEGTTLLAEEEGTTLLQKEAAAILLRRRTGDKIVIDGAEFHIGKSANADYTIIDNNAISRNHAVISRNFGDYAISDENSRNHTYVNGVLLVPGQQKMLYSGDIITMADEEFEFSI